MAEVDDETHRVAREFVAALSPLIKLLGSSPQADPIPLPAQAGLSRFMRDARRVLGRRARTIDCINRLEKAAKFRAPDTPASVAVGHQDVPTQLTVNETLYCLTMILGEIQAKFRIRPLSFRQSDSPSQVVTVRIETDGAKDTSAQPGER